MSKPTLRFEEFSSDWEVAKLGDLLGEKLSNGEMIGKSDFVKASGNFYLIQLNDLYESNIQLLVNKLQMVKFNENAKSVEVGDTLINRVSIKPEGVGKVTVITELPSNLKTTFESNMFRVRFASEKVYKLFFAYFSLTKSYEKQKLALSKTTNQSSLSQSDISFIEISYPKIPEQTKIANFLTAIDDKITQLTQKHDLLNQYKKGVMQQIFSQELNFKDGGGQGYPEWESSSLGEMEKEGLLDLGRGNVISKTEIDKIKGVFPIYSSSVKNYGLFGKYGLFMFDEELITWSIDGGGDFFYRKKHKFSVTNVSGYLRVTSEKINCKFLSYQLIHLHRKLSFDYLTKAHPSVIRELYIVQIPAVEEQTKIANFLTALDDKIANTQAQLEAVKQYKQGLLQKMFV